jgi:hypothetical protein
MAARRSRGDGGLSWDKTRQRWVASVTVGYSPSGRRIVRRAKGKSKTAAQRGLRELIRDHEDGFPIAPHSYTVADAVGSGWSSGSAAALRQPSRNARSWPTRT